jgi:hypothetical protein
MSPRTAGLLAAGIAAGTLLGAGLYVTFDRSEAIAPQAWVKSVCAALSPWRAKVATLTATAQQEMSRAGTPDNAKRTLMTLFGGAEQASDEAKVKVSRAGVPKVQDGSNTARRFVTALTRARDAYGRARTTVSGLETGQSQPFYDGVAGAFTRLNQEYSASTLDISSVEPSSLRKSFDEVPECR